MKIRTSEDLDALNQRIENDLGIDLQRYADREVIDNFLDLLVFPKFAIQSIIRPVLIAFGLFILGFFVIDLETTDYGFYALFGFILFMLTGLFSRILYLIWNIKSNILGIMNYSLDVMKSIVADLNLVGTQTTTENRKGMLSLLFKGVVYLITIPVISQAISDRIPFIGGWVNRFVKKFLIIITGKIKFNEKKLEEAIDIDNHPRLIERYSNVISSASSDLEKLIGLAFRITQFPFVLITSFLVFILLVFLYLIH